jgi:hypothetical protein
MQETVALEMDCSGSPRAAPNVGLTQGMATWVDCLGILAAVPNVGLMQGMVALVLDGLGSLEAAPNAPAKPATPTPTGDADVQVTVYHGNTVNVEGDDPPTVGPIAHTPHMLRMEDELWTNILLLQIFTGVDQKLHGVFGDTIYHNDGRHLNGGIGEDNDCKWQCLHKRVVAACLPFYSLPNSWWAKCFLTLQTALWHDVRLRGCNSEKACIFAPLILCQVSSKKTMSKVKTLVWSHMDVWEASCYCALVKEVEDCAMKDGFPRAHPNCSLGLELESLGQNSTRWCTLASSVMPLGP